MKNFRFMIIMGFILLTVVISKPVMALELTSFTDIQNFSVVIGENMYTLDYANDFSNESKISTAIVKNSGDIFIKTDDNGWIRNSDGTQVSKNTVDVSTIKFNNSIAIVVPVVTVASKVNKIQVNPNITITSTNTATFTYEVFDKDGIDITKTIPVSEIYAYASISSSISLNPITGVGSITFNSSYNISTPIIITLVDQNGITGRLETSRVNKIQVNPNITITSTNTATFTYEVFDVDGIDITNTIPTSEIYAYASVSSSISLNPIKGIGTITFNSSYNTSTPIIITLMDQNGIKGSSEGTKVGQILIYPVATKTGEYTSIFTYKLMDQKGLDITKTTPASQISAISSVASTIALDPSTATGTITYNLSADVYTANKITLMDTITGINANTEMLIPAHLSEVPRVDKITMASTEITTISGKYGYAVYYVYDQDGNVITNSALTDNITFNSTIATIVSDNGMMTITANEGIDFGTFYALIVTGRDSATGVNMSTTLIINNTK